MRTYFYLLALLMFSVPAIAQIQRGDRLIALNSRGELVPPAPASLGGLSISQDPFTDDTKVGFGLGLTYGLAVTDRLLLGAGVGAGISFQDGSSGSYRLDPFARYYFLNRPDLGVFGQVGTQVRGFGDNHTAFEQLDLKVGLQLPVAAGLLLTPAVEYTAQAGRNVLSVGAGLELLLQPGTEGEKPVGNYGKGTIALGVQSANLGTTENLTFGGLLIGGQYFLTDQLAAGIQLGFGYARGTVTDNPIFIRPAYTGLNVEIGASARYYLTSPKRLVWFLDGGAGYSHDRQTTATTLEVQTFGTPFLSAGGGAQYFLRDNLAVEVAPQFRYNFKDDGLNARTRAGVNFGFRVML